MRVVRSQLFGKLKVAHVSFLVFVFVPLKVTNNNECQSQKHFSCIQEAMEIQALIFVMCLCRPYWNR